MVSDTLAGNALVDAAENGTMEMNIRSLSNRTVRLAFGSAIAILLVMGILAYRSIAVSDESERWVQHTRDVLDDLQRLTVGMAEISSSIRRFVITG